MTDEEAVKARYPEARVWALPANFLILGGWIQIVNGWGYMPPANMLGSGQTIEIAWANARALIEAQP